MTIKKQLSNGLTVVLEEMPYFRSTSFGVWVKVGSSDEVEENNGIAHLIEHMLFKGTEKRSAKQIADEMAKIGGNINAFTSKECTAYYATTLSEHLPLAIEILGDMFNHSLIDEKSLRKEKSVILEEIDMYDDSPEDLAHELLQKKVWKNHPLGFLISGTKKVVRKITREQIIDFIRTYYVAENMVISVAGNFKTEEIVPLLEEQFGTLPSKGPDLIEGIKPPEYHRQFIIKEKDIEQLHCNIAFSGVSYLSEERFTLSILNSILGGSINSRLFQKIRETSGLTYSIYSYGSSYHDAGLIHIYAAMNPSQLTKVIKKIYRIIEEIKKKGVTLEELEMTKEQMKTELILGSESAKSRMNSNGKSLLHRGVIQPVDEIVEKINQVELEQVKEFANHYLDLNQCSISLIGNLKDLDKKALKTSIFL